MNKDNVGILPELCVYECFAKELAKEACENKSKNYYYRIMKTYNDLDKDINAFLYSTMNPEINDGIIELTILYKLVLKDEFTIDELYNRYNEIGKGDYFSNYVLNSLILVTTEMKKNKDDYFKLYGSFCNNVPALLVLYLEIIKEINKVKLKNTNEDETIKYLNMRNLAEQLIEETGLMRLFFLNIKI